MKNIYGVKTKGICINTALGDRMMNEVNEFLSVHDGNIIDINFVGQAMGQICAVIIYKEKTK